MSWSVRTPAETVPCDELNTILNRKSEAETLVTEELLWEAVDFYAHGEAVLLASLDDLSMRKNFHRSVWDCWVVITVKTINETLYRAGFFLTDFMERDELGADETMNRAFTEEYAMKKQHNPFAQ